MNPEPSFIYQIAERFGFPVLVCFALGWFLWHVGRGVVTELGRLTRAVSLVVLAMQFAPELHEAAEELYDESLEAAQKRKENLSHERQRPKKRE